MSTLSPEMREALHNRRQLTSELEQAEPLRGSLPAEERMNAIDAMAPEAQSLFYARIVFRLTDTLSRSALFAALMDDENAEEFTSNVERLTSVEVDEDELREGMTILGSAPDCVDPLSIARAVLFKARLAQLMVSMRPQIREIYQDVFKAELDQNHIEFILQNQK